MSHPSSRAHLEKSENLTYFAEVNEHKQRHILIFDSHFAVLDNQWRHKKMQQLPPFTCLHHLNKFGIETKEKLRPYPCDHINIRLKRWANHDHLIRVQSLGAFQSGK